jgi:hypothetical protein
MHRLRRRKSSGCFIMSSSHLLCMPKSESRLFALFSDKVEDFMKQAVK